MGHRLEAHVKKEWDDVFVPLRLVLWFTAGVIAILCAISITFWLAGSCPPISPFVSMMGLVMAPFIALMGSASGRSRKQDGV